MTQSRQQAIWFIVVGASAALVHFIVLITCVQIANLQPAWGNVIAFLIAFIVSFLGHYTLTFKPKDFNQKNENNSWIKSLIKWFASSIGGFLLNQALFILGLKHLGDSWYAFIWLGVTIIVTGITFTLGKLWAFKNT